MIRKFFLRTLLVLPILLTAMTVFCQSDPVLDSVLKGKDGKLVAGAQAYVKDLVYFDPLLKPGIYSTNRVSNIVNFRIDEYSARLLPDSFKVDASVRIIYTDSSNVKDSVTKTLTINYNKAKPYTAKARFWFHNAHEVNVRVLSLTAQYVVLDSVINILELENEMIIDRDYKLNCAEHSIKTVSKNEATVSTKGELQVSWAVNAVAEEYDLEWTYIDESAIESGRYNTGGVLNAAKLFKFNASQVTITGNSYNIPLLYDGDGKLYFRVRGAQTLPGGRRLTTAWSSDFISDGGLGEYDFVGHERKMNWQSSTSFAEDGKRKTVVQYFDGSLKGRQTVTKDNTTDTTIVAETFYDKQGRPVIQVLPAPSLSSIINFTPSFNTLNGAEYDKGVYDTVTSAADYCAVAAPKMDSLTGSSRYYSKENQNVQQSFHQYIPDALGYAFTETKYEQDNTGRINSQGGVGKEFRIGNGKETKYYYGEPDQEELDALFGTEAGYASHYQKNMVKDANGQFSVSYVDMHGRTVATALAGVSPANLEALPSNTSATVTTKLLTAENNLIRGTAIESVKGLIVTKAGNHYFSYSLSPESLGLANCDSTTICYDCLYDLEISVKDDCNNQTMPGDSAYRYVHRNFSFGSIDTTCSAAAAFSLTDTLFLQVGSYTVTKHLSINDEAMQYYRDSVYLKQNTCKSYEDIVAEQTTLIKSQLGDCTPDTLNVPDYKSYRDQMAMDMMVPVGQYANPDSALKYYSIFNETVPGVYRYQDSRLLYKDTDGNDYYVTINGVPKKPNQLSPEEFINNFQSSWADTLVKIHPEYSLLVEYEKLADSHIWDEDFEKTDTYAEALAKGYLNPTGNTTDQPAAKFGAITVDPLFAALTTNYSSGVSNAAKQSFNDSLLHYREGDGETFTAWGVATVIAKCPTGFTVTSECALEWNESENVFGEGLCIGELNMAWRFFRMAYQQQKQRWLDQFIRTKTGVAYPQAPLIPVFTNRDKMLETIDIDDVFNTDTAVFRAKANAQLATQIDSSCHQYAKYWVERLSSCAYPADSLNNVIIPRLIQVCKEGGDISRPLGSSTVKPSSTYLYKSFDDVIKDYNQTHSLAYNASCNGYLIDAPKPYGTAFAAVDIPTYSKPDSCGCARINTVYSQYQPDSLQYSSFSDYLNKRYNTTIGQGALDTLRNLCNGTITCRYIPQLIKVPAILQCGMEDICVDCGTIRNRYDSFKVKFHANLPTLADTSETQQQNNQLFASYMNQQTGLGKTTLQYLQFIDSCRVYSSTPSCDSITTILDEYRAIRNDMANAKAVRGYKLTPVKDEIIEGINGLLEWSHRVQNNRVLSPRYKYEARNSLPINKFFSIAYSNYSNTDSVFNMPLPLNLDYLKFSTTLALPFVDSLRATQVVNDTDFAGVFKSEYLARKYMAVSLMDEWGRFRFMWGARGHWSSTDNTAMTCDPPTTAFLNSYYGLNSPKSEFLVPMCQTQPTSGGNVYIANGGLHLAFYKMPQANPTITEYNDFRPEINESTNATSTSDRIPTGPARDSLQHSTRIYQTADIKKVLNFYIDTLLLNQYNPASNNYADSMNTRFMRARLEMMNGDTVNAFIYDNTSYFKYKQKVDTSIYNPDCEEGFRAYYNSKKGTSYNFSQIDSIYQAICGRSLDICAPLTCNSLEAELTVYYHNKVKPVSGYVDMPIRTFAGNITPAEGPKGVFDVNGQLIGNTVDSTWEAVNESFATIWNSSSANAAIGTLSALPDGMMRLALNPGQEAPCNGIIGQRFYQFEHDSSSLNDFYTVSAYGSYYDFGDGRHTYVNNLENTDSTNVIKSLTPCCTVAGIAKADNAYRAYVVRHEYSSQTPKTITIYHTDIQGHIAFDAHSGLVGNRYRNVRGYFPQEVFGLAIHATTDSTLHDFSRIRNFSQINSIEHFNMLRHSVGNTVSNIWYPSFGNNHQLKMLWLEMNYTDTISKSKAVHDWLPDMNINFPELNGIYLSPYDTSSCKNLHFGGKRMRNVIIQSGFTKFRITTAKIDEIINQVADGSEMDNGALTFVISDGTMRSAASDAAVATLTARGWKLTGAGMSVTGSYTSYAAPTKPSLNDSLPVTNAFTEFYNERHGTHYGYSDLAKLYDSLCGKPLDLCNINVPPPAGMLLCRDTEGEEVTLYQPDGCSDSTQLIAITATEIYKAYKDSLIGAFNEAYTAKCLNAKNLEAFTVNRPVSEYHYTLYYYDQAGNLVKTISPEGVHPNRNGTWLTEVAAKRIAGERQVPEHTLPVVYRYNSLNQVVTQHSPDGGLSKFWYDRLGRLAVSQNEKQLAANNYSYTKYDQLGRITEVGEKLQVTAMTDLISRSVSSLNTWVNYTYTFNAQTVSGQQVTRTVYDLPATLPTVSGTTAYSFNQKAYTLRNRVSNTLLYDVLPVSGGNPQYSQYNSGSYYSYDIHGNVDTLLQDYRIGLMADNGANRFKLTAYKCDLISGKVNEVHYQPGEKDQFYHRYEYDAENRITDVYTTDVKEFVGTGSLEDKEAFYQYYKHGPLARTILGQQQVQGIDYAYTLQGWLKGVNSTSLRPDRDMGRDDGSYIARDVYGFNLNYFTGDYSAINSASRNPFPGHTGYMPANENKDLYNGNISSMAVNIGKFSPMLYNYHYDQLNRIVGMDAYRGLNQTNNTWLPASPATVMTKLDSYKERVAYDANGNILSYLRNGTTAEGRPLQMDSLTYKYFTDGSDVKRNNRLRMVRDAISATNYTEDIDDQLSAVNNTSDSNYVYDAIGNLIQDKAEKITDIKWNVYGKILEITKTPTDANPVSKISYTYDAAGNRISKKTEKGATSETTWYVRDAQGNVLGVYTDKNTLTLSEHHIYGSSRLGIANRELTVADPSLSGTNMNLTGMSYSSNFERGKKFFELSNHLGNVLVTISDRKLQVTGSETGQSNGSCETGTGEDILDVDARDNEATYIARTEVNLLPGFSSEAGEIYDAYIDASLADCIAYTDPSENAGGWHFAAEVVSANDYYPFGSLMPGRKFSAGAYRYGFNGKENDNDVKGEGNQQDYGMRIYDSRLGKFLSVDPLMGKFPFYSPYHYAGNSPIKFIDLDGGEPDEDISRFWSGQTKINMTNAKNITGYNAAGVPRAANWFFRQLLANKPEMFSESNKILINAGSNPTVNSQWIKYNPTHAGYENQTLWHHHIDGGEMAVAIPKGVNNDYFSELHPYLKSKASPRGAKIKGLLGGTANFLGNVGMLSGLFTGDPDSWINAYGSPVHVGDIKKDWTEGTGLYIQIMSITSHYVPVVDENGRPVIDKSTGQPKYRLGSKTIEANIYKGYIWNEDTKKYEGVDKIDSRTEEWKYDEKGKRIKETPSLRLDQTYA